jgi:hypothetical protein
MANLVKIKDVHLYVGLVENGHECYQAKKLLDAAGVKFNILAYNDETQIPSVFVSLNTWGWGPDHKQRELDQFPLIHWTECYDDFSQLVFVAHGLIEIKESALLQHGNLTS